MPRSGGQRLRRHPQLPLTFFRSPPHSHHGSSLTIPSANNTLPADAGQVTFSTGCYLQADAYGGYDGIYLESGGAILEVTCWAHTRRYWYKARDLDPTRAHHVLAVIGQLYKVERAAEEADAQTRWSLRAEHSAPLLADLKSWLDDQEFLPKSIIGQAATYTRNQWNALNRYVDDGDLSIDNNAAERSMKPVAIGRKNWLFVGSSKAGHRAATLMSLIASCKANSAEPWAWLRSALTELPRGATPESLLPDTWLQTNPDHRWTIADHRKA